MHSFARDRWPSPSSIARAAIVRRLGNEVAGFSLQARREAGRMARVPLRVRGRVCRALKGQETYLMVTSKSAACSPAPPAVVDSGVFTGLRAGARLSSSESSPCAAWRLVAVPSRALHLAVLFRVGDSRLVPSAHARRCVCIYARCACDHNSRWLHRCIEVVSHGSRWRFQCDGFARQQPERSVYRAWRDPPSPNPPKVYDFSRRNTPVWRSGGHRNGPTNGLVL